MKPARIFAGLLVLLILSGCRQKQSPALTPAPVLTRLPVITGASDGSILSGGITREFHLYVPSGYSAGTPAALVVNIHGLWTKPTEQEMLSGMTPKAEQEGFIVVYPAGRSLKWEVTADAEGAIDVQFIIDLVAHLQASYSIDPRRIYATGMSNGGGMTSRLGCDAADLFAAIAPVAGAYNGWKVCNPSRPIPVLSLHGTADNVVRYAGVGAGNVEPPIREWAAAWAKRNRCDSAPQVTYQQPLAVGETWQNCRAGAEVVLYTLEGHGHSWPGSTLLPEITTQAVNATDVIWEFFTAHPMP